MLLKWTELNWTELAKLTFGCAESDFPNLFQVIEDENQNNWALSLVRSGPTEKVQFHWLLAKQEEILSILIGPTV